MGEESLGYRLLEKLPKQDLDFIITTVTKRRTDYDEIRRLVAGKPDLIDIMLDDEGLFQRVISDQEILLKISPYLLFTILVRKAKRDLEKMTYTMEPVGAATRRLPLFDAKRASSLLEDANIRDYLSELLTSFTRVNTTTVYFRDRRGLYHKRTYSDMNPEDMKELSRVVSSEFRFGVLKRIGDICLFLTGMFPDYVASSARRKAVGQETEDVLAEYEETGIDSFRQAADLDNAEALGLRNVLYKLSEHFSLARKPLNLIGDQYIHSHRDLLFGNLQ